MIADASEIPIPIPSEMSPVNLDDTVIRRLDDIAEVLHRKPGLPPWVLPLAIYLIGQLVGGVWWAARMQSDVWYLQQENQKLWQKVETHDLILNRLDSTVRAAVKDAMEDADYVRIPRKGGR